MVLCSENNRFTVLKKREKKKKQPFGEVCGFDGRFRKLLVNYNRL